MKRIIPELLVEDMETSLRFYRDVLGFSAEVLFPKKKPVFAKLVRGGVAVMLYLRDEFEKEVPQLVKMPMGGTVGLFIEVERVEEWWKRLSGVVKVVQPVYETDYGTNEFSFEDINGYVLIFSGPK